MTIAHIKKKFGINCDAIQLACVLRAHHPPLFSKVYAGRITLDQAACMFVEDYATAVENAKAEAKATKESGGGACG